VQIRRQAQNTDAPRISNLFPLRVTERRLATVFNPQILEQRMHCNANKLHCALFIGCDASTDQHWISFAMQLKHMK
jgi:hypothetical protein